jgi:phage baseplate assembly protein V
MPDGIIDAVSRLFGGEDQLQGIAVAQVVDNVDATGEARVQVRLPWLPGYEPWARVTTAAAGDERGFYCLPQIDDEVLVAFAHGDVSEPFVIGCLWNGKDKPPTEIPTDASSKVILKTPKGHVVELDDLVESVTITTIGKQKVTLDSDKVELEAGGSKATLETSGKIELSGGPELTLKATTIKLQGTTIKIEASGSATLSGSGECVVSGGVVRIN